MVSRLFAQHNGNKNAELRKFIISSQSTSNDCQKFGQQMLLFVNQDFTFLVVKVYFFSSKFLTTWSFLHRLADWKKKFILQNLFFLIACVCFIHWLCSKRQKVLLVQCNIAVATVFRASFELDCVDLLTASSLCNVFFFHVCIPWGGHWRIYLLIFPYFCDTIFFLHVCGRVRLGSRCGRPRWMRICHCSASTHLAASCVKLTITCWCACEFFYVWRSICPPDDWCLFRITLCHDFFFQKTFPSKFSNRIFTITENKFHFE